jgi:hypothetical protein
MPADGMFAAYCNDRDFGTSRWPLSVNATRNCCGAGGGSWHKADIRGVATFLVAIGVKADIDRPPSDLFPRSLNFIVDDLSRFREGFGRR